MIQTMILPDTALVEATDLSRYYSGGPERSVSALDKVSFRIKQGEFVAITGPSGCGKSTLLNLLAALDTPDSGQLRVGKTDLTSASEAERTRYRRSEVGIVFQFFNLLPGLSLEENVALPLRLQGIGYMERREKARLLLDFVGLDGRRGHFPHQLSGGEMQRAAVARALIHQPGLIIADEPTGNLDSAATERVLELFRKVHQDQKSTLVLVTHSESVAATADRRLVMMDGKMREEKAVDGVVYPAC
ncbi:MAG: ABC transporter ATP-binding protein [Verrucomicrobiales bacterium]